MTRIILALAVLLASLCMTPERAVAENSPRLAKIIEVDAGPAQTTRRFFGHVVAKETVDLAFQVGGQVIEFPVVEGAPIAAGGLIARLDLEPFELALDQAKVQLEQAERTFERLDRLRGGAVSEVSVQDAETQRDLAGIAVRDAERSLREATLFAPFDALVASRTVAKFSSVSAGAPVVRLHDMSELRVNIEVPEIMFQQAGENPDVEVSAVFPASDRQFRLETREFNAETSSVGQTFRITLGMEPPTGLVVLPGSSVTVFATFRGEKRKPTVPASAIVTAPDGSTSVMVFSPTSEKLGVIRSAPVTIAASTDGRVIVTEGLNAGDEVVASGAAMLAEGETVRRFEGFEN